MNAVGYEVGVDAADLIGVGLIEKGELMLEMLLSRLELNLRSIDEASKVACSDCPLPRELRLLETGLT